MSIWSNPEEVRANGIRRAAETAIEVSININERILGYRDDVFYDADSDHNTYLVDYHDDSHYDQLLEGIKRIMPNAEQHAIDDIINNIDNITFNEIRGDSVRYPEQDVAYAVYIDEVEYYIDADAVAYEMNEGEEVAREWTSAAIKIVQHYQLSLGHDQVFGIEDSGDVSIDVRHWVCRVWDRNAEAFQELLARHADQLSEEELAKFIPEEAVHADLDWEGEIREIVFRDKSGRRCDILYERQHPVLYIHVAEYIQYHWELQPNGEYIRQ